MVSIIGSNITEKEVIYSVRLTHDEVRQLGGCTQRMCLFSRDLADFKTQVYKRGRDGATKYFLIPKELRKGINFPKEVPCHKLETKDNFIFMFFIDKIPLDS